MITPVLARRAHQFPGVLSAERVLLICRAALAVGGLGAEYLDPTQPSAGDAGYLFLGAYALLAVCLLLTTYRVPLRGAASIAAHAVEVGLVSLVILYTEGPTSPFFVYFTFVLMSAALRWHWQGTLVTGALLSLFLIVMTMSQLIVAFDKSDIDRLVVRNIYLIVVTCLFAFFGDQLRRSYRHVERLSTAQELHDGILQTLTAVGLKIRKLSDRSTGDVRNELADVGQLLAHEHRQLRSFVSEARTNASPVTTVQQKFRLDRLDAEISHLRQLWNCETAFRVSPVGAIVPAALARALKPILAESVANAVLHGRARRIEMEITRAAGTLRLCVNDDGLGLPDGAGSYEHEQLAANRIGPQSIRHRVEALGGSMRLDSSEKGVRLDIRLPLDRKGCAT